jgi:ABC-type proline/glycine betaine transport system permease subunit
MRGYGDTRMTSNKDELDDIFSVELIGLFKTYGRAFLKAWLIAMMAVFSIWVFTDSVWKALFIGFAFLPIALFRTWSRFLEPVSLVVFLAAVAYVCDQNLISHFKLAFAQ